MDGLFVPDLDHDKKLRQYGLCITGTMQPYTEMLILHRSSDYSVPDMLRIWGLGRICFREKRW